MSHEKLSLAGKIHTYNALDIAIEKLAVYAHNTYMKTNQGKTL